MPSFDRDYWFEQPLDWRLFQNGFVHLFFGRDPLERDLAWLTEHGYKVVSIDVASLSDNELLVAIGRALDFPPWGGNLDALDDCLSDVATYEYGSDADDAGLVLVLLNFDRLDRRDAAIKVLDVFAQQARFGLLIGHRMLCIVHADDRGLALPRVGSVEVERHVPT